MELKKKKIVIVGHAGHGKDEVASIISKLYGYKNVSATSIIYRDLVTGEHLKEMGVDSKEELAEKKTLYRSYLYNIVREFVKEQGNESALIEKVLEESDIYSGVRCDSELRTAVARGKVDLVLYVDADRRVKIKESENIMNVGVDLVDYFIYNNGSKTDLENSVKKIFLKYA